MTANQTTSQSTSRTIPAHTRFAHSHYAILGLHPSASVIEIRRAYRKLSKQYHPDTTDLPADVATMKFQRLNEAYGILSNPERRSLYDLKIGYSRWNVIQDPSQNPQYAQNIPENPSRMAYLDASDRPLSSGEIFALFIMGFTFIGCLLLVILVAFLRGDALIPPSALPLDHQRVAPFLSLVYAFALVL